MKCKLSLKILMMTLCLGGKLSATPIKVFILAGQSNMSGYGKVYELPSQYSNFPNFEIYHSLTVGAPLSYSATLNPGIASDRSDVFGPEIGIAIELSKKFPNEKIVFIKVSQSGSWLKTAWSDPASTLYQWFWDRMTDTRAFLDDRQRYPDGYEIHGMFWMQGESDASDQAPLVGSHLPGVYRAELKKFVEQMVRQRLVDLGYSVKKLNGHLPFAYGLIRRTPWAFGSSIINEQREAEKMIPMVRCTEIPSRSEVYTNTTDQDIRLGFNVAHYTTRGTMDVGFALGKTMVELLEGKPGRGCGRGNMERRNFLLDP